MKETTRDVHDQADTGPAALAHWLTGQLTDRGYDLSNTRSGGRAAAAADSGLSPATMSRLLHGERTFDIDVYRRLAHWLGHPLGDILVRVGLLTPADLTVAPETPITPEQAADRLGLTGRDRDLFLLNLNALRRTD